MIVRRFFVVLALAWTMSGVAFAAEYRAFDRAAFAAAQAEGRPILIEVAADWCPVCREALIIRTTGADAAFASMIVFRVDYDTQRQAWRGLNVRRQSTLIAFHGARETGRLVAVTDARRIEGLMRSAIR